MLKPLQHVCSFSLTELVAHQVMSQSYHEAADTINGFLHLEGEEALSHTTLKDRMASLGTSISKEKELHAKEILSLHDIDTENGSPITDGTFTASSIRPDLPPTLTWKGMEAAIEAFNSSQSSDRDKIKSIQAVESVEASPSRCCLISIDDVGVKHQKESRQKGYEKQRKNVENTVIHIEADNHTYHITATTMRRAFYQLLAFLLKTGLMEDRRLIFLTDGATNIKEHIERFFSFRQHTIILDWLHLKKKAKEYMSMAVKAKPEDKKEIVRKLLNTLSAGNVKDAKDFLGSLEKKNIKNVDCLNGLIAYLGRKEPFVPCYAVRHMIGLRTSSNRVEKANDLIVA